MQNVLAGCMTSATFYPDFANHEIKIKHTESIGPRWFRSNVRGGYWVATAAIRASGLHYSASSHTSYRSPTNNWIVDSHGWFDGNNNNHMISSYPLVRTRFPIIFSAHLLPFMMTGRAKASPHRGHWHGDGSSSTFSGIMLFGSSAIRLISILISADFVPFFFLYLNSR